LNKTGIYAIVKRIECASIPRRKNCIGFQLEL